ncbi:nuclease domain-containing protein [Shewanella youngdeokensis]|uniref:Nuclease domain-containing protein n=1 Tax=Shewanella youngdeokensis TaxID=2999068 RepID=A0ABZ0K0Y3_9GAMM|nr:nuclease domain-containing protein [Shewanella sp. DAU334]
MSIEWLLKSNSSQHDLMSESEVFVPDDIEYELIINTKIDSNGNDRKPELYIGDIAIKLGMSRNHNKTTSFSSRVSSNFFDNAHFLNYFGESELVLITHDKGQKIEYTKVINVTLKKKKADIAIDMLNYLSKNMDDIAQICFSKTRSGFKPSKDTCNNTVKFENLKNALEYLEVHIESFSRTKKTKIRSQLEMYSDKPPVYDHNTTMWLLSNFDKLKVTKKQDHNVVINRKFYNIELPKSNTYLCTDEKENHVIHYFLMTGINYCLELRKLLKSQEQKTTTSFENNEYIRFDQVIKNSINPIIKRKGQKVDEITNRLIKLKKTFDIIAPINKLKPQLPIQTSYTLKNNHYSSAFNLFKYFYDSNGADRSNDLSILMGIRNLSQIYEFSCLYQLVNALKQYSYDKGGLITTRLVTHDKTWEGKQTMKINVLANQFVFKFDKDRDITLYYEKPFHVIDRYAPQDNTIIRISKSTRPYRPDYTIRVDNKSTGDHHYIILDAKFMTLKNVRTKYKEMHSKYAQELKSVKNKIIDNTAIKYVGLLYALSEDNIFSEDSYISAEHKPNGMLPISPYFSSFHLGVEENGTTKYIIENYLL